MHLYLDAPLILYPHVVFAFTPPSSIFFQKLPCSKACRTGTKATPKERGLPNLPIAIGLASHHQSCDFGMSMDWNFSATKMGNWKWNAWNTLSFHRKNRWFPVKIVPANPLTICSMVTKSFGDLLKGGSVDCHGGTLYSWMVYFMEIHGNPENTWRTCIYLGLPPF